MMRLFTHTHSYQLELPEEIESEQEGRVSSFWCNGKPLLLQISSYIRTEGSQVSAEQRLEDRLAKTSGTRAYIAESLNGDAPDQAAAKVLDANKTSWLYAYLVWPHLAIFATISGPEDEVNSEKSWARSALMSLSLLLQ